MNIFKKSLSILSTFPSEFRFLVGATLLNQLGNMVQVFLVLYLTVHLGFSLSQASFAFAMFALSVLGTNLLGGSIIDRFGPVRLLMIILCVNSIVLMSFTLVHSYHGIVSMCIVWGITFGLYRPCSQTFVTLLIPDGQHKIGFSVYRLAINLGMSMGPAIGGYLAGHSFPAIFIANGIANLSACLVLFLGFRQTSWLNYRSIEKKKLRLSISLLKSDKTLMIFLIGMIPISMVFFQHNSTMSIFLSKYLHLPFQFYGLLFTINTLIIVFCEIPLNVATIEWSPRFSLALGSFLIALGFFGFLFAESAWHVVALTVLWTMGEMILYPSAASYIAELAPENLRGSYMSIYSLSNNLGNFLGPWSGLLIMHHFGVASLWGISGIWGMVSVIVFGGFLSRVQFNKSEALA